MPEGTVRTCRDAQKCAKAVIDLSAHLVKFRQIRVVGIAIGGLLNLNDEQVLSIVPWLVNDEVRKDTARGQIAI